MALRSANHSPCEGPRNSPWALFARRRYQRVCLLEDFAVLGLVLEPLRRVLPDRLQHPVALVREAQQALLDERLQRVEVGVRDLLGRVERAAPDEDGERSEDALLLFGEEVVAPGDRRPERLLPRLGVSAASQQVEAMRRGARGSALGESAFVRAAASSTASGRSSRRAQSSVISSEGSSRERSQKSATASDEASGGTAYSTSPCTRRSSRLVTRSVRLGQACDEPRELGRSLDHLLQVVEEKEHLALADVLGEPVPRSERLRDRAPSRARVHGGRRARPRRRPPCTTGRALPRPPARVGSCPSRPAR